MHGSDQEGPRCERHRLLAAFGAETQEELTRRLTSSGRFTPCYSRR
jgi:hypothetical protein